MDISQELGHSLVNRQLNIKLTSPMSLQEDWPFVLPFLDRSRESWERYYRSDDLFVEVLFERMHLWTGSPDDETEPFACALTTFVHYPRAKVLHFVLLAGDGERHDYLDWQVVFREYVERWARQQNASFSSVKGRKPWEKILAPYGYIPDGVHLLKTLGRGLEN